MSGTVNGHGAHASATQRAETLSAGVPGRPERHRAPEGRGPQHDRDVLASVIRRFQGLDPATITDPGAALDIFVEHLAGELDRRGYVRRSGDTIVARLRTPPGPLVGSAVLGGMAAGLLIGLLLIGVYGWWT